MKTQLLAALTLTIGITWAAPANAAATPDKIVGDNSAAAYWFPQSGFDCEEAAFDVIYGDIKGSRMHETTVDNEAIKLGVYDPKLGSMWWGGIDKLSAHYGIKMTTGNHKIATVETALAAGKHVMAFVDSAWIWNSQPSFLAKYLPEEYDGAPDHILVVDSINLTKHTVTLTDTGPSSGALETVSIDDFSAAVATSNYSYAITD